MMQIFLERKLPVSSFLLYFNASACPKLLFAAGEVGETLEKRKSQCGYYQLWRRGEKCITLLWVFNLSIFITQQNWDSTVFVVVVVVSTLGSRGFKWLFHCFLQEVNTEKLTAFINTLNGKEGTGSHLVTVPPGPSLADALLSSPILAGEGGSMMGLGASDFEFGVDPSADPELALVSKSLSYLPNMVVSTCTVCCYLSWCRCLR